jgi:hypothetical protein
MVTIHDEYEAGDLLNRYSIYTKEREFEYLGRVTPGRYSELVGKIKKKVEAAIREISQVKTDDEGYSRTIVPEHQQKRLQEIRTNEQTAHQKVLAILAQGADKTPPKRQDWIFMDEKARIAVEGAKTISV